jgi:hypothetical protein
MPQTASLVFVDPSAARASSTKLTTPHHASSQSQRFLHQRFNTSFRVLGKDIKRLGWPGWQHISAFTPPSYYQHLYYSQTKGRRPFLDFGACSAVRRTLSCIVSGVHPLYYFSHMRVSRIPKTPDGGSKGSGFTFEDRTAPDHVERNMRIGTHASSIFHSYNR